MKFYHFPSPNPQKVSFALRELNLECDVIEVDLTKGEQRKPDYLALNPLGLVPVLVDGDLTLWESHAIISYLGEKTGKLWPTSAAGRADALRWLFFLSAHISPPATDIVFNRIAVRRLGLAGDDSAIARGEKALPPRLAVLEAHLAKNQWMLGQSFSLVDCAYTPVLNALDKAQVTFSDYPNIQHYFDACRNRQGWKQTPKLPGL